MKKHQQSFFDQWQNGQNQEEKEKKKPAEVKKNGNAVHLGQENRKKVDLIWDSLPAHDKESARGRCFVHVVQGLSQDARLSRTKALL